MRVVRVWVKSFLIYSHPVELFFWKRKIFENGLIIVILNVCLFVTVKHTPLPFFKILTQKPCTLKRYTVKTMLKKIVKKRQTVKK